MLSNIRCTAFSALTGIILVLYIILIIGKQYKLPSEVKRPEETRTTHSDSPNAGSMSQYSRSFSACARLAACDAIQPKALGHADTRVDCAKWNLTGIPSTGSIEMRLLDWSQLWTAAIWALHFKRPCRGSSFPLYASNGPFSNSALLGPPAMQSLYGFVTTPFLAYMKLAVAQVCTVVYCTCMFRGCRCISLHLSTLTMPPSPISCDVIRFLLLSCARLLLLCLLSRKLIGD